jgi:FAD/FMN-containing dehydrogenase
VQFTVSHGVQVRARSGGHSYAGYSTLADGVVLDLRRLNGVTVDQRNRTATIGAGNQLIDVSSRWLVREPRFPPAPARQSASRASRSVAGSGWPVALSV